MGVEPRILVVDDDADMLHLITMRLNAAGYAVAKAASGEEALVEFRNIRPQLVVTDLCMGGMDGLQLFEQLQIEAPTLPVIILTAHGTIPDAISATRRGVFSFLTKPFDGKELLRRVADAIRLSPQFDPVEASGEWRSSLITVNVAMEEILRQARRIASEQRPALLIGPSGAGKTTLARAIHRASQYADGPFVVLECTDHPAPELEALLRANSDDSIFHQALNGVLYIRDVAALSALAQSRLFAVLFKQMQSRDPLNRLKMMASEHPPLDLQIIVSSPRPLDIAVADNGFRNDLFYLLSQTTLLIPPLTERREDIPALARHFLGEIRPESALGLTPEALEALRTGIWPGNVQQLRTVLAQAAELSLTPLIPEALIRRVMHDCEEENLMALDDARREFEREYLIRLLRSTAGNVAQAARVAQRNRTEFYKLLARHALDPANFKQKFR